MFSWLFGGGGPKWSAEEREMFREIALAEPDDAEPRLRLAAALEKRGEPMGEYIRLTHEAEALPEGDPARERLEARLEQLMGKHGRAWTRPMKRAGLDPMIMGHFYPAMWMTHGVFDQLELDRAGVLPRRAAELFAAMPALRQLSFSSFESGEPDIPGVAALPQMEQIGELSMTSIVVTLDDLRAIARSPHLKNLRVLRLQGEVGAEGARLVAGSRSLKRLRHLELHSAGVGDEGAAALAGSANLAGVAHLRLEGVVVPYDSDDEEYAPGKLIGPAGAAALAGSPHLAAVRTLDLSHNRIGAAGAKALAGSPHLRPAVLVLRSNRLDADAGRAPGSAAWLAGVTELNLDQNALADGGTAGLAGSRRLASLKVLHLGFNTITGKGLAALLAAALPALTELRLAINEIGPDGAEALAAAALPSLAKLDLGNNPIADAGAKALAKADWLGSVTELHLNGCQLGAAGVRALAASPRLRALRELHLHDNPFGQQGAEALAKSPHLTKLERLYLGGYSGGNKLEQSDEAMLYERFGDVVRY